MSKNKPHTLAKVFHNYQPQSENEIPLVKGEIVKVYEKFDNGWWVGETPDGKLGVFPGSYVKEPSITAKKPPTAPEKKNTAAPAAAPDTTKKPDQQNPQQAPKKRKVNTRAEVLYDYQGETETELSLKKGTIIHILRKLQDDGWWQGEYEGRYGHFPAKFVREILPNETGEKKEESKPNVLKVSGSTSTGQTENPLTDKIAFALHDYNSDVDYEISFKKGEQISIFPAGSDKNWRLGIVNGNKGLFPANYVSIVDISALAEDSSTVKALALYKFDAAPDSTELDLQKGDLITVHEKGEPQDWWVGSVRDKKGHFPGSYVKILPTQPEARKAFPISPQPSKLVKESDRASKTEIKSSQPTTQPVKRTVESNLPKPEPQESSGSAPLQNKPSNSPRASSVPKKAEEKPKQHAVSNNSPETEKETKKLTKPTEKEDSETASSENRDVSASEKRELALSRSQSEISEESTKEETSTPKILPKKLEGKRNSKVRIPIGTCVSKYTFEGNQPGILSFAAGDVIQIYSKSDSGWWKGELNGQVGYFPGSYVREKNVRERKFAVKALFDYTGESETELSFKRGDIFLQLDVPPVGKGWVKGERKGNVGHYPPNFVEPISSLSAQQLEEISLLRTMVENLQGSEDLFQKFEESERIRIEQEKQILELTAKVEAISSQVSKQSGNLSRQQKTVKKLQSTTALDVKNRSASVCAPEKRNAEEIEQLRDCLAVESRQRKDLELLVRKLETSHEILNRNVTKLQRTFEEQTTEQKIGKDRLRPTGRDLTQ